MRLLQVAAPPILAAAALCVTAASTLVPTTALAQETVDIGTIADEDIVVVQRLLYPKDDRTELGAHLGVMPFDAYLLTPNIQLSFDKHFDEKLSFSVLAGGGYGLKNGTYRELSGEEFGVEPDAYRYLGSVLAGVAWSPIYAKMNVNADRIIHHDAYVVARAGVTFEASTIPEGGFFPSPTLSLGGGMRLWLGEKLALRMELRDDILVQRRKLTSSTHVKQNVSATLGITTFSAVKRRTR